MQPDAAVAGRVVCDAQLAVGRRRELEAGRRRRHQTHGAAVIVERLVDVAPQQAAHPWVALDHGEQRVRVRQADEIAPGAADDDRVMVQADQRMARRIVAERRVESGDLGCGERPVVLARDRRIEEDEPPSAGNQLASDVEAVARQDIG